MADEGCISEGRGKQSRRLVQADGRGAGRRQVGIGDGEMEPRAVTLSWLRRMERKELDFWPVDLGGVSAGLRRWMQGAGVEEGGVSLDWDRLSLIH